MKVNGAERRISFGPTEVADACFWGIVCPATKSPWTRVAVFMLDLGKWLLFDTNIRCGAGRVIQTDIGQQRGVHARWERLAFSIAI
jgi:hypothetical protein